MVEAYISLSKALITKASVVIPIFPIYATLLYKVMKEKGLPGRGTIEQKHRLLKGYDIRRQALNLTRKGDYDRTTGK